MTLDEALERLRDDWALCKADDYSTDTPGWGVYVMLNGEMFRRIGWGDTPAHAIAAAESGQERSL